MQNTPNAQSTYVCDQLLSCLQLFATPEAHQAPLSMEFSRQEYWHGLPFPTPGDLPDPEIEPLSPTSPVLQADSLPPSHWESPMCMLINMKLITSGS